MKKLLIAVVTIFAVLIVVASLAPDQPQVAAAPQAEPTYGGIDAAGNALWTDSDGTTWRCDSDHNCTRLFNMRAFAAAAAKRADADKAAIEAAQ